MKVINVESKRVSETSSETWRFLTVHQLFPPILKADKKTKQSTGSQITNEVPLHKDPAVERREKSATES